MAAPEVLSHGTFTTKSDVYAFGLTLWFVETEEDPLSNIRNQFELIRAVVMDNQRPSISKCTMLPDLIQWCWQNDSADRPTFDVTGKKVFQQLVQSVMCLIKWQCSTHHSLGLWEISPAGGVWP